MRLVGGFLAGVIIGGLGMTGILWYLGPPVVGEPASPGTDEPTGIEAEPPQPAPTSPPQSTHRAPPTGTRTVPQASTQQEPNASSSRTSPTPTPTPQRRTVESPPPGPDVPPRTDADVEEMAVRRQQQINACYQLALAQTPSARGTIRVRISVSARGRVTDARIVADSMNSPAMASCLLQEIRSWRFPEAAFDYTGVHTFSFAR